MLKSLVHRTIIQIPTSFFFRSSSSSSRTSKFHNYYLRKRRKWPHPVYRSRWHQKLSQQHALQALKSSSSSPNNLLSSLVNSFTLYNCSPSPNSYRFLLKTLIKTSQPHQIPPVLNRLEKVEKFDTPESIFVDLIEFHGDRNEFQRAIDVFFKIPNFRCDPSVDSLNCLLSVLCKRKEGLRIVPLVLLKSRLMNIRLEGSSFCVLIEVLCRFKNPKSAIDLLYHMVDNEIEIDEKSFSLIFLTLCQQNDLNCNEVKVSIEEMKKLGFCLGMTDWRNLIRFLVKREKGMEALEALHEMKSNGFIPDVVCYTVVLDGVISGRAYESAEQVFDEMLVLGLVPDIYTYNVYVKGLCNQNKFDDGIKMLLCMEEIGCKPNMITYNTLLGAMYESGELGNASDFLNQMRAKGVAIHSRTYEIMINKMVSMDDISEALVLLEEMVGKNLVPQPSTVDEILCRLCQNGLVSKALSLLTQMISKNVLPGRRAWEALILGFGIEHTFKEFNSLSSPMKIIEKEIVLSNSLAVSV